MGRLWRHLLHLSRYPRTRALRWLRFQLLLTPVVYVDRSLVTIDPSAQVGDAIFNTASGTITVGAYVLFGHGVSILTGRHDYTKQGHDRMHDPMSGCDIVIEDGAWLASNVTVIGPCRIGRDAVVAAGSVVTKDVPPGTLVAGVPARVLRHIDD